MRSFLWKAQERLSRFMYGRYGIDRLYWFLFALWILLSLLSRFPFPAPVQLLLWGLSIALMVIMFFRVFSRNTYKRYAEGQKFDALWNKAAAFFRLQRNRFRDRKTKVYRHCPSCKAVLRFPRIKGSHAATCPRCGTGFDVKV